jgi:hypothetical protein
MKITNHISLLSTLLFVSIPSLAIESSDILLEGGGIVRPQETVSIVLDKLTPNIYYRVTCVVSDPNNEKDQVVMKLSAMEGYSMGIYPPVGQARLIQIGPITFDNITTDYQSIKFTNLDQHDMVRVEQCKANPMADNEI